MTNLSKIRTVVASVTPEPFNVLSQDAGKMQLPNLLKSGARNGGRKGRLAENILLSLYSN
jgi:hypothetical protein